MGQTIFYPGLNDFCRKYLDANRAVAREMAKGVIKALEPIDIAEGRAIAMPVAPRAIGDTLKIFLEVRRSPQRSRTSLRQTQRSNSWTTSRKRALRSSTLP